MARVTINLTADEQAFVKDQSWGYRLSTSAYVRKLINQDWNRVKRAAAKDTAKVQAEIASIGQREARRAKGGKANG